MIYPLVQYGCDNCGALTEVLDPDQPLPKGWTLGDGRYVHYCPKCSKCKKNRKVMMTKRDDAISSAAREYSSNRDNRTSFICDARWADEHPDAVDMSYLQNWYQDSIDETIEPIWTDKHLEELYEDFYLIPKK